MSASSLLAEPPTVLEPSAAFPAEAPPPQTMQPEKVAVETAVAVHPRKPALPALSGLRTLLAIGILLFHFTPPHVDWLHPSSTTALSLSGHFF